MDESNAELLPLPREKIIYKQMTYEIAPILAKNYASVHEAMGDDMFKVFEWGNEGLKGIPKGIKESLEKSDIKGIRYRNAEYMNKGEYKRHLFIDKELDDGTRCIYVVNLDKSSPYLYRLDNLYAVGAKGETIDLLEEVDPKTEAYFSYLNNAFFSFSYNKLFFGDFDLLEKRFGEIGMEVYLHEIGHYKDTLLNADLVEILERNMPDIQLTNVILRVEDLVGSLRNVDNRFVRKIVNRVEDMGRLLYLMEENASNFARGYITRKRDEGVDLAFGRPFGDFSKSLDYCLANYHLSFFGYLPYERSGDLDNVKTVEGLTFKQKKAVTNTWARIFGNLGKEFVKKKTTKE